ncbi:agmatinase [Verminephrobacter aporrectodeae]|uniref:agmatinase n=1 Tax=Verminephrobacter aporrectodeae TaxID=1110389 RepID=UPI002237CD63|nr:agmatinase [Verminephrobacter aporrectodeae]MCW5222967.1 agmatinase [Verminephrobacter aporrectodeae subsp. tuberculatae]MCW5257531.1 agmatinase [Verminephrobacter aporrectodeae subsp. tuberculatae]MCW5288431.1 agmatinase [Verminephrobacter aporrectodeae subsp. tuberculatae]MCW8174474.1 agmatinase [Verminephrobacter aporrectodeae subsp. tuberculatae]MCW8201813.1 agmatinase [Verminephrobacter aporrectodeae subsp. tuberculatae]
MTTNTYETGRLNLPFVGHSTFAKSPVCVDWDAIDADVAVLGAPNDMGTQWRSGARFGPRAIREASTLFSFGHAGAYDFEDDILYLTREDLRIVDVGDADIVHTDMQQSHANVEMAVRKLLERGAFPLVLGGDHSIHAPVIKAFEGRGPIHILHIDAHLDFVDERHGVRYGHGSPLRRASELDHIVGMTQIGIRNVSSSNRADYQDAIAAGSRILSVRDVRRLGTEQVLALIPQDVAYYITVDIDGFDPSIAPGTGTPSHGGFLYYEVLEIIQALSLRSRGNIVGMDLVEVAPAYDPSGITSILAAQLLLNSLGYIFHHRRMA